ncbi:MAG: DUF983 domain-containing protein [Bacteroidetes bacterium]|nr:DUF983 domain-containing protein [Bacteroidota bacterium]
MTTPDTKNEIKPASAFDAALHCKCPKCRKGDMFKQSSLGFFNQKMHTYCPYCHFQFEMEPGYFYVAMFVSYGMIVAEMITTAVGTYALTQSESPWLYIGLLLGVTLLLSPFNFRYSRVILLYWLTPKLHYDPERAKKPYDEQ